MAGLDIVVGVVSFESSIGCDKKSPSGYSRVPYYLNWIHEILNIKCSFSFRYPSMWVVVCKDKFGTEEFY